MNFFSWFSAASDSLILTISRRLVRFNQMDFEFALWQMLYLFISPQKVYRNFGYRRGRFLEIILAEVESFGRVIA